MVRIQLPSEYGLWTMQENEATQVAGFLAEQHVDRSCAARSDPSPRHSPWSTCGGSGPASIADQLRDCETCGTSEIIWNDEVSAKRPRGIRSVRPADPNERRWSLRALRGNPSFRSIERSGPASGFHGFAVTDALPDPEHASPEPTPIRPRLASQSGWQVRGEGLRPKRSNIFCIS